MYILEAIWGSSSATSVMRSTSIVRAIRLLRLTRLLRVASFMSQVPEFRFMVTGLLRALRAASVTLFVMNFFLFTCAIVLRQLSEGTDMGSDYFPSVLYAMFTLFIRGVLLDNITVAMVDVATESYPCACILGLVIFFGAMTLMNMMTGTIVGVMTSVSAKQEEEMRVVVAKAHIRTLLQEIDQNADGRISKHELQKILTHKKAVTVLRGVGVDVYALVDFADFIFQSDSQGNEFEKVLSFDDFMTLVLQLRGTKPATVRDIVDLQQFIHDQNRTRNRKLEEIVKGGTEQRRCLQEQLLNVQEHAVMGMQQRMSLRDQLSDVQQHSSQAAHIVGELWAQVDDCDRDPKRYEQYLRSASLVAG